MKLRRVTSRYLSKLELSVGELHRKCDPETLDFKTTDDLEPLSEPLNHTEALEAINFGLSIRARGFNIYVSGPRGSGKTSTIRRLIKSRAEQEGQSKDICYIYNFEDPFEPRAVLLPPGAGRLLSEAVEEMAKELHRETPRILSASAITKKRKELFTMARNDMADQLQEFMAAANERGIHLEVSSDGGFIPGIYINGDLVTPQDATTIQDEETKKELDAMEVEFYTMLQQYTQSQRELERAYHEKIREAETSVLRPLIERLTKDVLKKTNIQDEDVKSYIKALRDLYLENYRAFLPAEQEDGEEEEEMPMDGDDFEVPVEFRINVLVDGSKRSHAPVVEENNPTCENLVGYLEYYETRMGLATDHTLIRPGALHRANGGYLILQAEDVLTKTSAWSILKKALRHKEIRIEPAQEEGRPKIAGTVKPSPVPLDVKVILVGNEEIYYLMQTDEDFSRLFKVKAEFMPYVDVTGDNIHALARFLGKIAREEGYLPVHASGVARFVEHASRQAEDQGRISTRTSDILDLLSESDYWARVRNSDSIKSEDVDRALEERRARHNRLERELIREIREKIIVIEVDGKKVGQINGLTVYDLGDYSFGMPARITATVYAGDEGVISIDREVNLTGEIHDKGSLILAAFIGQRFGRETPLKFSASITFEQNYGEIEGDSASSTELFALLSSLSGVPIKQGIAVTGSVSQDGRIQAIGGVNQKIEGFFQVCKLKGLTGKQGVIIPRVNMKHLMLSDEILEAVNEGKFHIWAIDTIDQGMEILTGVKSGKCVDGQWEEGTINYLAWRTLVELSERAIDSK